MVGLVNQWTRRAVTAEQRGQHPYLTPCAGIVQWQDCGFVSRQRRFDSRLPAPVFIGALVHQLRRLPLKQENLGQHEGALPFAAGTSGDAASL